MAGRSKPEGEKLSARLPVSMTAGLRAKVEGMVDGTEFESASEVVRQLVERGLAAGPKLMPSRVPVYRLAGTTAAGPWLEATEHEMREVSAHELTGFKEGDYLLLVDQDNGDCLTGDGIWPGDSVHIRPGIRAEAGDIVHVTGTDTFQRSFTTLKHFHPIGRTTEIELRPSNPKYNPLRVKSRDVTVHGVLVGFTHKGRIRRQ